MVGVIQRHHDPGGEGIDGGEIDRSALVDDVPGTAAGRDQRCPGKGNDQDFIGVDSVADKLFGQAPDNLSLTGAGTRKYDLSAIDG